MNELNKAAKAVIDLFDDNFSIADCEHIDRLRAAVERAVNDDFDEWWEKSGHGGYWDARLAWIAAQHAERKRIIEVIRQFEFGGCGWFKSHLISEIDK